jgi:hypothetical protein
MTLVDLRAPIRPNPHDRPDGPGQRGAATVGNLDALFTARDASSGTAGSRHG